MTIDVMDKFPNLQTLKDTVRGNLSKYTRRAFSVIPGAEVSHILDIGCGSGVPTIELTKLSKGKIIAIDNDRLQLEVLEKRLKDQGLEDRVETVCRSLKNMSFDDESFDLIWSEGSIFVLGFERGLKAWRRLLRPVGYMAIHDERGNVEKKLNTISGCGYELLDHFILDRNIWWNEYYSPLEKEMRIMRNRYSGKSGIAAKFGRELQEIEMFKKKPEKYESVFFILRKNKL